MKQVIWFREKIKSYRVFLIIDLYEKCAMTNKKLIKKKIFVIKIIFNILVDRNNLLLRLRFVIQVSVDEKFIYVLLLHITTLICAVNLITFYTLRNY